MATQQVVAKACTSFDAPQPMLVAHPNRQASPGALRIRLLVIGGRPFGEKILMWWNFVARDPEEIAAARSDWEAGRRFGEVAGYHGRRLSAPDLLRFARPTVMS